MKLLESKFLESDIVELTLYDSAQSSLNWTTGETAELLEDDGSFYLKQGALFEEVTFSHLPLAKAVNQYDPQVVCCVICYKNNTAVAVQFMYLREQCAEDSQLFLDQSSISTIAKSAGLEAKFDVVKKWFEEQFYFNYQEQKGMLCEFHATPQGDSFIIVGKKNVARIIKNGNIWYINAISPLNRTPDKLTVFYGSHQLVEHSASSLINNTHQQLMLEQHTKEHGSYFQLWQKYSETHWQQSSRIAKSAGYLKFSDCKAISDEKIRYRFILGENPITTFLDAYKAELEKLDERYSIDNLELQVAQDAPEYLTDSNQTLAFKDKQSKRPIFLSELTFKNSILEATLNKKPPENGVIFISLNGIQKQQQRKMMAFEILRQGKNPLPQIKHIFEGLQPPEQRTKRFTALSKKARKRFKGNPTVQQEKALKVALETPDIALIIGPPGTGKTQVISALQQRIAEEGDKFGSSIQHQILLSSYQHDAVTNVVARSGVFGLPALKIGGKEKSSKSDSDIKHWTNQRIEKLSPNIDRELEKFEAYKLYQSINEDILSIRISRHPAELKFIFVLLKKKIDSWQIDYGFNIKPSLIDNLDHLMARFEGVSCVNLTNEQTSGLYRKVRALRTTDNAYNDDGFLRAQDLLLSLKEHSVTRGYAIDLQKLIIHNSSAVEYDTIKQSLLEALVEPYMLPDARHVSEKEINNLEQLQLCLEQEIVNHPVLGRLHIRQKYVENLKNKPALVKQSIAEYVTVLGATCQQAAGDKMVSVKSVEQSNSISFDSVIIDEAARANPLDLMIPMAMARTRIVLVGDHKQLPHMLEPRVENELQDKNEIEIAGRELLKQSLFERLYLDLKKFEQQGGAKKRVVMLDTQFRMHPVLGDFHSKEFYESCGLPKVKAGLPAANFPLDVPGYKDVLAAWINVDQKQGRRKSRNGSKYRQCEADIISEEAEKILKSRPDLSVGIITFYAAQRDVIQEIMVQKGIMKKTFDEYGPVEGFDLLPNGDERFRVGSVDAFQGKEFDVVLLSTVRHWKKSNSINADLANQQLGFLRIINRINVAMSRQKRLLIVVGDDSLADQELVNEIEFEDGVKQQILSGFNAFYQLCKGEYGSVC